MPATTPTADDLRAIARIDQLTTHRNMLRGQADWNGMHGNPQAAHYESLADCCDVEIWDLKRRMSA